MTLLQTRDSTNGFVDSVRARARALSLSLVLALSPSLPRSRPLSLSLALVLALSLLQTQRHKERGTHMQSLVNYENNCSNKNLPIMNSILVKMILVKGC